MRILYSGIHFCNSRFTENTCGISSLAPFPRLRAPSSCSWLGDYNPLPWAWRHWQGCSRSKLSQWGDTGWSRSVDNPPASLRHQYPAVCQQRHSEAGQKSSPLSTACLWLVLTLALLCLLTFFLGVFILLETLPGDGPCGSVLTGAPSPHRHSSCCSTEQPAAATGTHWRAELATSSSYICKTWRGRSAISNEIKNEIF